MMNAGPFVGAAFLAALLVAAPSYGQEIEPTADTTAETSQDSQDGGSFRIADRLQPIIICTPEPPTGSRLRRDRCTNERQRTREREQAREFIDDVNQRNNTMGINPNWP